MIKNILMLLLISNTAQANKQIAIKAIITSEKSIKQAIHLIDCLIDKKFKPILNAHAMQEDLVIFEKNNELLLTSDTYKITATQLNQQTSIKLCSEINTFASYRKFFNYNSESFNTKKNSNYIPQPNQANKSFFKNNWPWLVGGSIVLAAVVTIIVKGQIQQRQIDGF